MGAESVIRASGRASQRDVYVVVAGKTVFVVPSQLGYITVRQKRCCDCLLSCGGYLQPTQTFTTMFFNANEEDS